MKKRYLLPFLQAACFMLLSLLLQNCGGLHNLPLEGEAEPVETREQIESQVLIIVEEHEQNLIEQEGNSLPTIMPELWQEVFSYLDFEGVLAARAVNSDWNQLITGYREAGIVGVGNKPTHIIDTRGWVKREEINFSNNALKELTPVTIPSFAFYHLIGHVRNLPQSFWPYLPGTQVHTLDLRYNLIKDEGALELTKVLPNTQVHTLNLEGNLIRAEGAIELAKALSITKIHTFNLYYNLIGDAGALEFAKALPATRVHTFNLGSNLIGDAGASELAKALPSAQVHTLHLENNQIRAAGAIELAKALPSTKIHILHLGFNQIGDTGAIELAKALSATRVHILYLYGNQIGAATQQLLKEQYPHIKWEF